MTTVTTSASWEDHGQRATTVSTQTVSGSPVPRSVHASPGRLVQGSAPLAIPKGHGADAPPEDRSGSTTPLRDVDTPRAVPEQRVRGLRRWEGSVTAIDGVLYTVRLSPASHRGVPLDADFRLEDLTDHERGELAVGSVVYVTVRKVVSPHGLTTTTASVRLRRFGQWTADEVAAVDRAAAARSKALEQLAD